MAEQFYDINNPARRAFHERFIRQNLDNFEENSNVIQFTSAEFSGPLHFVQFWLDAIQDWEKEHRHKVLVALAAPKNVQDGILADTQRSAIVDVIAFRYWWQTDEGLYAPEGGQNLAPRQFQRQSGGGAPSDANLAAMAAEYRAKFPFKPVIAASEQGLNLSRSGWAYVCAGGSMPNLPRTSDSNLLAAVPEMQPWGAVSKKGRWVLREAGKQYLICSADKADDFDLTGDSGSFVVRTVNSRTGEVSVESEIVQAGGKVPLPRGVVWLTKAK